MRNRFDKQLDQLNTELILMGSMIERSIAIAVKALENQDVKLAKQAIEFDNEINEKEKEIESICLKLLLQQQPVAGDLRLISSALKMITDMERIGDQAADIAELTVYMADKPYFKSLKKIPEMARATIYMVTNSIEAFVQRDTDLAEKVIKYDDNVDELFCEIKDELIHLIRDNVENGEQAVDFLMVAKYFERIGDHAVNIAEWVEFSITGKHKNERVL